MKYKNFIFDCGMVLFGFSRDHLFDVYGTGDVNDKKIINNIVYGNWYMQDIDLPSAEFYEFVKKQLPTHLHKCAHDIIFNWKSQIWEFPEMKNLIKELKEKGIKLYLLSNMPDIFVNDHREVEALKYFDDLIFSFPLKIVKPDPKIFEYLIKKHNLEVKESLFIDDSKQNIDAAIKLGIDSYLFDPDSIDSFIDFVHKL